MVNQAQSWFFLECDSIRDDVDKSKEFYLLEVFNADTQELFVNVTSDEPVFQVCLKHTARPMHVGLSSCRVDFREGQHRQNM